jgi:putative flavoprotein involved in K+ transport
MELNYWSSSTCKSATYDEATKEWSIVVDRDGESVTLHPKQLVLATGMSGIPNVPAYPGADTFRGLQHHSSSHPGGEEFRGKKCVVIGSNNSAHDICADLWEHGAEVTMVQRSSTQVVKSDTLTDLALSGLYSEQAVKAGVTKKKADLIFASVPYRIMAEMHIPLYKQIAERDADFYERLGGKTDLARRGRQRRHLLGPRFEHGQRSGPVARRVAEHVEADAPTGAMVSWR